MRSSTSVLTVGALATLVLSGCSDSGPSQPHPPASPVQVTLEISSHEGSPDRPLTFAARAWRSGEDTILYYRDCCSPAVWIELTDPGGNTVLTRPFLPCGCPVVPRELEPEGVTTEEVFDGTVYEDGMIERKAVPGHYQVTARFGYYTPPLSGLSTMVTITKTFTWRDTP